MYKIIIRSIFYQWLILFVGVSIGFIANAEYFGYKSLLLEKSINHIFFPIEFTPEIEKIVKEKGAEKVYHELEYPDEFEILGDVIYYNDEFYWCKYKFRDKNKKLQFGEYTTRIRWKTWEYYYGTQKDIVDSEEKACDLVKKFDEWHSKIRTTIKQADEKEKQLLKAEKLLEKESSV